MYLFWYFSNCLLNKHFVKKRGCISVAQIQLICCVFFRFNKDNPLKGWRMDSSTPQEWAQLNDEEYVAVVGVQLGQKLSAPTTQACTFIWTNNANKCCWYACPSLPALRHQTTAVFIIMLREMEACQQGLKCCVSVLLKYSYYSWLKFCRIK